MHSERHVCRVRKLVVLPSASNDDCELAAFSVIRRSFSASTDDYQQSPKMEMKCRVVSITA